MRQNDEIPHGEIYRGVKVHLFQPDERVAAIVRPAIDLVAELSDMDALFRYAADVHNPPEARAFSTAKCLAGHELAADARLARPDFDPVKLQAVTAGISSFYWIDPRHYRSLLCARPFPEHESDRRPPEEVERLLAAYAERFPEKVAQQEESLRQLESYRHGGRLITEREGPAK
ncbi:hypothetical protein AMST5_03603 [freshwater sediment metagenome]|uniref:Uncharacterized protein n=1 Tax=freshwater sediment metagenome TaxID=556182 RepID=A0AA48M2C4_9ZZZZ